MEKIASFTVDHERLRPGLYVSRKDFSGGAAVTTFDLRFTAPAKEPPLDSAALHTIEHLFATRLRLGSRRSEVVYFGPMGCRTGCYLLLFGDLGVRDALPLVLDACDYTLAFEGEIPGAKRGECGNYLAHDLGLAKYYVARYRAALAAGGCFDYPD